MARSSVSLPMIISMGTLLILFVGIPATLAINHEEFTPIASLNLLSESLPSAQGIQKSKMCFFSGPATLTFWSDKPESQTETQKASFSHVTVTGQLNEASSSDCQDEVFIGKNALLSASKQIDLSSQEESFKVISNLIEETPNKSNKQSVDNDEEDESLLEPLFKKITRDSQNPLETQQQKPITISLPIYSTSAELTWQTFTVQFATSALRMFIGLLFFLAFLYF